MPKFYSRDAALFLHFPICRLSRYDRSSIQLVAACWNLRTRGKACIYTRLPSISMCFFSILFFHRSYALHFVRLTVPVQLLHRTDELRLPISRSRSRRIDVIVYEMTSDSRRFGPSRSHPRAVLLYSVPSEYDHSRELPESFRNSIVPLNKII